jgi:radical SAM superfamily enzyme YgiQ (UPF0313 family)
MSLAFLSAALERAGIPAKVLDYESCLSKEFKKVSAIFRKASLIGVSVPYQFVWPNVRKLIKKARCWVPDAIIVVGGHFPSFEPSFVLTNCPEVDMVLCGEADQTLPLLAKKIMSSYSNIEVPGLVYRERGKIIKVPATGTLENMDDFSFPNLEPWKHVIHQLKTIPISSSRGCFGGCNFCSISAFYASTASSKWRACSPSRILEMIEFYREKYRLSKFEFYDDNFLGGNKIGYQRAGEFAFLLRTSDLPPISFSFSCRPNDVQQELFRQLYQVGLRKVYIGIESYSDKALKYFRKGSTETDIFRCIRILQNIGVQFFFGFIFLHPNTTMSEIRRNLSFLRKFLPLSLNHYMDSFGEMEVYAGTPVYFELQEKGLLKSLTPWSFTYEFKDPDVRFFSNELNKFRKAINRIESIRVKTGPYHLWQTRNIRTVFEKAWFDGIDFLVDFVQNFQSSRKKHSVPWGNFPNILVSDLQKEGLKLDRQNREEIFQFFISCKDQ